LDFVPVIVNFFLNNPKRKIQFLLTVPVSKHLISFVSSRIGQTMDNLLDGKRIGQMGYNLGLKEKLEITT
jgi:hypothetical protein